MRVTQGELILGRIARPCGLCDEPTFWARRRQRTKGFCMEHSVPESSDLSTVIDNVWAEFDISDPVETEPDRSPVQPEVKFIRGHWLKSGEPFWFMAEAPPSDAGPCVGCGVLIHRYGANAVTHCSGCFNKRES